MTLPNYSGLPFPGTAYLPGRTPRPAPSTAEVPYVPPERFAESAAFLYGVDLFNRGFSWEAHEAWEGLWRRCARGTPQHRTLQGLIQIAASYLKRALGVTTAADDLLARGTAHLEAVAAEQDPFHGFALAAFVASCRASPAEAPRLLLDLPDDAAH